MAWDTKLTNIEIGKISPDPKLSDIWCRNSRTKRPDHARNTTSTLSRLREVALVLMKLV
jgi:hypothetical protein